MAGGVLRPEGPASPHRRRLCRQPSPGWPGRSALDRVEGPGQPMPDARRIATTSAAVAGCSGRCGSRPATSSASSPCARSSATSRSAASGGSGSGAAGRRHGRPGQEQRAGQVVVRRDRVRTAPPPPGRRPRRRAPATAAAPRPPPRSAGRPAGRPAPGARRRCAAAPPSPRPRTTSSRSAGSSPTSSASSAHASGRVRRACSAAARQVACTNGCEDVDVVPVGGDRAGGVDGVQRVLEAARPGVAEVEAAVLVAAERQAVRGPLPHRQAGGDDPPARAQVVRLVGHAHRPGAGLGDQVGGPLAEDLAGEQAHPVDVEHASTVPAPAPGVVLAVRGPAGPRSGNAPEPGLTPGRSR